MGTFAKSARFQVPKNGTSGAETKKPRPLLGFKPILKIWLFGAVLPSKNDQNDKGADGGLKIFFFLQKFFFILFCITKLLYKTLGPEKVYLSPPPTVLRSLMHGVLESKLNSGKAVKLKKIEPNSGRAVKLITSRCLHSLAIDAPGSLALL